jgi:hypothetical protein
MPVVNTITNMCGSIFSTPLLGGALLTVADGEDVRQKFTFVLLGFLIIIIIIESIGKPYGIELGEAGKMVLTAFPLLLGYWFGQKEAEQKA